MRIPVGPPLPLGPAGETPRAREDQDAPPEKKAEEEPNSPPDAPKKPKGRELEYGSFNKFSAKKLGGMIRELKIAPKRADTIGAAAAQSVAGAPGDEVDERLRNDLNPASTGSSTAVIVASGG